MKKPVKVLCIIGIIFTLLSVSGCQDSNPLDAKNPITLTMWHNFGGSMQSTMDMLLDEFNSTIGKEEGIIINVTAISSSKELQENLDMIVNGDPGAPEIPDLFTAYPKTAFHFQEKDMIVNFDDYFTDGELSEYVSSFLQEGRFGDNGLYVFPFAKSTEILYLNKTLFDRFTAESDITIEDLATIEGIVQTSVKYYDWTDAKTPDIKDDGKMFFTVDSWFNFTQAIFEQQGEQLVQDNRLNLAQDTYTRLWNLLYPAVAKGGIAIYDGYSSDLSKTGDLVCSIGSTAGIVFYADTITYSDNTVEEVEYNILPYPIMNDKKKVAIQRGNGLCVTKSTKAKEYAASVFIKWFTNSAQNIRFISSTGYLPVTKDAFQNQLPNELNKVTESKVKAMLTASINMYNEYEFFIPPIFDQFDAIGKEYEANLKVALQDAHEAYKNDATNLDKLSEIALKSLIK